MAINLCDPCNQNENKVSLCTKPASPGNVWIENGYCTLDKITYEVVIHVLSHIHRAANDLREITDDPMLLELANKIGIVRDEKEDNDILRERISGRNTLHFYTVLRGNIDGSVR
jgi:hypothetical protein